MPIIGLTADFETTPAYSAFPWYALRENYVTSLSRFGATPIILPHETASIPQYLDLIDGLLITGGHFDISPDLYGEDTQHNSVKLKENRTLFEAEITRKALERDLPILGICGGQQLLHVLLGGKLIQHIPDEVETDINHSPQPGYDPVHDVRILPHTKLHQILGVDQLKVNSSHHQAAKEGAKNIIVNALSPDGVIEGIESPSHSFCLGVQWHPEYLLNAEEIKLFQAFVQACTNN